MITRFRNYITESAAEEATFEKAKAISPWIKSAGYREKYLESLDELKLAAKQKEIYKARFGEYKPRLMRGIEYAYRDLFEKHKDGIIKSGQETIDLWSISMISDIKKVSKIYDKMTYKHKDITDFMDAIRGIPDALNKIKSYVKSGKPPKEPKPGQFVKPMASYEASKLAKKYLDDAVDSFRKNFEADVTKRYLGIFEKIKDVTDPSVMRKALPQEQMVGSLIFVSKGYGKDRSLELLPGAKARVEKAAKNTVEDITDHFVAKNTIKIASIFERKAGVKEHKILKTNIQNNTVENTMSFVFNDGSEFTLESKVIFKMSKNGKYFTQFPTRFRNVKMADGSMMKAPSEEKIIKEF